MSLYGNAIAVADRQIAKVGQAVTLNRVTPGAYDPATGETAAATTVEYTGVGAVFDYEQREIAGDVRQGDRKVLLAPTGMVLPRTTDTLTIGSATYAVVAVSETAPAGIAVMYEVRIRGLA